ncbi:hypothetical protein ACHAXS_004355 [Conticribra weissflogii]
MEYSTTSSAFKAISMSNSLPIDPNKELFDDSPPTMRDLNLGPSAPPPSSAPPPVADHDGDGADDDDDDEEAKRERAIEGGGPNDGGGDDGVLHLSVTDPQELGEGRNRHTFYRIDVRTSRYGDPISSVRRRYSDFQWLFQRLHAERPGAIIPIIPHTQAVNSAKRFSEELVEERRRHLERFLRGVQVHPELEGCPSISAFFSPEAEVFEAAKRENPASDKEDSLDSPTENFREKAKHFFVKTRIKARVMSGGELEETSDGAAFEEVEHYLNSLEAHVKAVAKATKFMVNVSKETSSNMHELGQTLFGMVQDYDPSKDAAASASHEVSDSHFNANSNHSNNSHNSNTSNNSNGNNSKSLPSLRIISNVFASLSAIHKVKHDENDQKVTQPLQTIEWSLKSARLALKRRKERQITYNTYLQQIKNRQATVDKLRHNAAINPQHTPNSDAQMANAQTSLDNAKQMASKALEELDDVSQRVFREMDRLKAEVDESLRRIYVEHARVQVGYSRQLDAEWNKLAGMGVGVGGGPGPAIPMRKSTSGGAASDTEVLMI